MPRKRKRRNNLDAISSDAKRMRSARLRSSSRAHRLSEKSVPTDHFYASTSPVPTSSHVKQRPDDETPIHRFLQNSDSEINAPLLHEIPPLSLPSPQSHNLTPLAPSLPSHFDSPIPANGVSSSSIPNSFSVTSSPLSQVSSTVVNSVPTHDPSLSRTAISSLPTATAANIVDHSAQGDASTSPPSSQSSQTQNPNLPMSHRTRTSTAFNYTTRMNFSRADVGAMQVVCNYCEAKRWRNESPSMCCALGKVCLPPFLPRPQPLLHLLTDLDIEARQFRDPIRKYNSCFQMTSFGADRRIFEHGFMPTFKIQGKVYHRIGPLAPQAGTEPSFLQIYFMEDQAQQAERRLHS